MHMYICTCFHGRELGDPQVLMGLLDLLVNQGTQVLRALLVQLGLLVIGETLVQLECVAAQVELEPL